MLDNKIKRCYNTCISHKQNKTMKNLIGVVIVVAVVLLLAFELGNGVDKTISNQDTMLCNSAKKSGNADYFKKCACFYEGQDISCVE